MLRSLHNKLWILLSSPTKRHSIYLPFHLGYQKLVHQALAFSLLPLRPSGISSNIDYIKSINQTYTYVEKFTQQIVNSTFVAYEDSNAN